MGPFLLCGGEGGMTPRYARHPSGAVTAIAPTVRRPPSVASARTQGGFVHQPSPNNKKGPKWGLSYYVAERVGFEPTVQQAVHLISSQAHSTTLAPLRLLKL